MRHTSIKKIDKHLNIVGIRLPNPLTTLMLWAIILAGLGATPNVLAQEYTATMQAVQAAALLTRVAVGQSLKLENVLLDGESKPVTLQLERFEVFAPDARIVVHRPDGEDSLPPPAAAHFRGGIPGRPDSLAVLSADPSGTMRGIVQEGEKLWVLGSGPEAGGPLAGLTSRELRQSGLSNAVTPFQCGIDKLPQALRTPHPIAREALTPQPLPAGQFYNVPVAIETDDEFFNLFGNTSAATLYIGNLFAYASTIYQREANTKLTVSYVSLWSGGPNSDPWNHTGTYEGLLSFQNYWNTNRQGVKRATAHFLSARNLGGGIAYLGVLCDGSDGYGYSASIRGDFQITNPQPVWDLVVVTHEIGHNFNSPHTHCYGGIGGNGYPVDGCYNGENDNGCWQGAQFLPGINSLTGGTPSTGNGTIMSYCHLLGGGMSNLALKFGLNHQYGIAANRVSGQMSSYVAQVASANPSCISVTNPSYTLNVTKTGSTGSGTVTSSPAGIACGTDCTQTYNPNTSVTLTATPAAGSAFTSWSGCTPTTDPKKCTVTINATTKTVTAKFTRPVLTTAKAGSGSGLVTGQGINCGLDCSEPYNLSTVVTLTAAPATGSIFAGWTNCTPAADPKKCTVTMSASKTATARFNTTTPGAYALTLYKVNPSLGAVVSSPAGITCGATCGTGVANFANGATVTLTATPVAGSVFASWSGCTPTTADPKKCTVTMTAAKNITASFKGPDLIVTQVSSPSSGKVGGTIRVSVTFKNQGAVTAQSSWVEFLLSKDTVITTSDISTGWGCPSVVLAPGASYDGCGGDIKVPANLAPGTYYLGAYADKREQIAESNETNNGRAAANTIVISQ